MILGSTCGLIWYTHGSLVQREGDMLNVDLETPQREVDELWV